jgi:hypothetical protein
MHRNDPAVAICTQQTMAIRAQRSMAYDFAGRGVHCDDSQLRAPLGTKDQVG